MTKLYLAHTFSDRKEIRAWSESFARNIGLTIFNPFYDGLEQKHIERCDNGEIVNPYLLKFDGNDYMHHRAIVDCDLGYIDECDGLIIIITSQNMIGAICEFFYCAKALHKPAFVYVDPKKNQRASNHPWILRFAHNNQINKTIEDLEQQIVEWNEK